MGVLLRQRVPGSSDSGATPTARTAEDCKAGHTQTGGYKPFWDKGCELATVSTDCADCHSRCRDKYTWGGALNPCLMMCSYGWHGARSVNCP